MAITEKKNDHSLKGEAYPLYGVTGENHPSFGLVPGNVVPVNIYNANDKTLIQSFPSRAAAARFLNVDPSTVSRCVKSGKILLNLYIISNKGSQLIIL